MLSITDNFLYVIDSSGRQQLFDVDKLKSSLLEAFELSGNPNGYLAEDIACAVEAAMAESARAERIFTQSEVDAAVSRILENAGCANTAQAFRRANSHLYIALDASVNDANMLIMRHLGVREPASAALAEKVVDALKKLNIASASPALYLELARYYEHHDFPLPEAAAETAAALPENTTLNNQSVPGSGKFLLKSSDAKNLLEDSAKYLLEEKIITLSNVTRLYPNFRLSLNLSLLADKLELAAPVTELEMASSLYTIGEKTGRWLMLLCEQLHVDILPLYLVLPQLDDFCSRYLGTSYPEGRLAALEIASLFRNSLGYPVKKVRCRTNSAPRSAN